MSVASQLLQGSYKGVPFLFSGTSKSQGRNIIVDNYPYRTRGTQDLGEVLATYELNIVVTGADIDYYQNKAQLENALKSPDPGVFIHPTDGQMLAQASIHSVSEDITGVGRADYKVTFIQVQPAQFPTDVTSNVSGINNKYDSTIAAILRAFSDAWNGASFYLNAISKYKNFVDSLIDRYRDSLQLVPAVKENLTKFVQNINSLEASSVEKVTNPSSLAQSVLDTHDSMIAIASNADDITKLNAHFFSFDVYKHTSIDTTARIVAERNRKSFNLLLNTLSMVNEYKNTTNKVFNTEYDITQHSVLLENQYNLSVQENYSLDAFGNRIQIFDQDTMDAISSMRDDISGFMNDKLVNTKSIAEIFVQNRSLIGLTYALYDNLDYYDMLAELNKTANQGVVSGMLKVFIA
jgi:hypothetical protein